MNIFLCGQKHFGATVLEAVAAKHTVLGVSSPPFAERLATDGSQLYDRVRATAERLNIPWQPTLRVDSLPQHVDVIIAAHSHDFIGRKTRDKARIGAFGYHPSLLPVHRGRDAVRWTIHNRDRIAGGSVYWLTDHVDGGPLAAQEHVFVRPGATAESLWREQLAPLGVKLILQTLDHLANGIVIRVPQDEACATWEPSFERAPLYRPELLQIGSSSLAYVTDTLHPDAIRT